MQLGDIQVVKELICILKIFRRLSPTTDHDIHTNKSIRYGCLDMMYLLCKESSIIMTVHQFKYRITTTLKRNMKMRHESTTMTAIIYQFITEQIRLQTANPITMDTLYSIQGSYKIFKAFSCGPSEITDVHSCEDDFLSTLSGCLRSLSHEGGYSRITTETTCIRNGAIGAEIIAAILYLEEVPRTITTTATWCKRSNLLCLDSMERRCMLTALKFTTPGICQNLYQISVL